MTQAGSGNQLTVDQSGSGNSSTVDQDGTPTGMDGVANEATITQSVP
ncbi:MAG: curlin repeat-containing protein [Rhodobacteraceae bacterium]|nr:curlin repeat-containing protein [Paracoccaceae bacterium]